MSPPGRNLGGAGAACAADGAVGWEPSKAANSVTAPSVCPCLSVCACMSVPVCLSVNEQSTAVATAAGLGVQELRVLKGRMEMFRKEMEPRVMEPNSSACASAVLQRHRETEGGLQCP